MKKASMSKTRDGWFDFANPTADMISLSTIAHCLARECRFANHLGVHYSVAEHCVHMVRRATQRGVPANTLKAILLHDASEAYTRDIPSPLKTLLGDAWRNIEDRIMDVVHEKWGVDTSEIVQVMVKDLDTEMYVHEDEFFYGTSDTHWLPCWDKDRAEMEFLREARGLGIE
jgi:hypothetical protein